MADENLEELSSKIDDFVLSFKASNASVVAEQRRIAEAISESPKSGFSFGLSGAEGFWLKRVHTLVLSGNGAALVLLGSFMGKSTAPIETLQASKAYFIPFLIGTLIAAVTAFIGVYVEELSKRSEDTPKTRLKVSTVTMTLFLIASAVCFIWGLYNLGYHKITV